MSFRVQQRTDYSTLFGSLSTNKNNAVASINLADYSSIKNGSYGKLLKAYYAETSPKTGAVAGDKSQTVQKTSEAAVSSKTSKISTQDGSVKAKSQQDKASALSTISTMADAVSSSADKLISKGTDSLFATKATGGTQSYDTKAIQDGVSNFINSYNNFINKASDSSDANVARETSNMQSMVKGFSSQLSKVGITIGDNGNLSMNKDTFANADMNQVKNLFNGNQSMAYSVASKTSMIGATADSAANTMKNYTNTANYADSYSVGSLLTGIM